LKPRWIAGVLFWILFLLSLALNAKYRWIGWMWSIALWLGLLGTSIYFVARAVHNRSASGASGYPRWFLRFAYDDDEREDKGRALDAKRTSANGRKET
jgi:hypothetical protein